MIDLELSKCEEKVWQHNPSPNLNYQHIAYPRNLAPFHCSNFTLQQVTLEVVHVLEETIQFYPYVQGQIMDLSQDMEGKDMADKDMVDKDMAGVILMEEIMVIH